MNPNLFPQDQVFWYVNSKDIKPLMQDITTDVVIVGGGMAGLTAAQSFAQKGREVILIEKNYCGAGASGKSSGFITPDSELSLSDMIDKSSEDEAKKLWDFINTGVNIIKNNITTYNLACDYQPQDTLVVATSTRGFRKIIQPEHHARIQLGYQSSLYTQQELPKILASTHYYGGVSYGNTFGIHGFNYCQGMKTVLTDMGVKIYEESPAIEIKDHYVKTPHATIKAQHIIVAMDHAVTNLNLIKDKVYHVQTALMLSAPLSDVQVKKIFPNKHYLVWDTDMIYHYFRLTGDNRLLLGGAGLLYTYAKSETHNNHYLANTLNKYFATRFPHVNLQWDYMWPGLIGISKDVRPIAGFDKNMPSVYYLTAAAGLPVAAAIGNYSAERIVDNNIIHDDCLSPYRNYILGSWANNMLGTRLTFALNNFLTVGSL